MRRLAVLVLVALSCVGCSQSDDRRTDRIDIDGVDCVVVRNGLGRIQRTDCNWQDEGGGR